MRSRLTHRAQLAYAFVNFFVMMPLLTILMRRLAVRKTQKAVEKAHDRS